MPDWKQRMQKSVQLLSDQLSGIRPGTVSVGFVETFKIGSNGTTVPIQMIATVASRESNILVTPHDRRHIAPIIKALTDAKFSAYSLNPSTVNVSVPPISGEQKDDIARHIKRLGEDAKVAVRSIRQGAKKSLVAEELRPAQSPKVTAARLAAKSGDQGELQKETDVAIQTIDRMVRDKISKL